MLEKIKNNKKKILILFALFLVVFLVLYFFSQSQKSQDTDGVIPTATLIPTPAEKQVLPLPNIYPKQGEIPTANEKGAISLFFERHVDPDSIQIDSTPQIAFNIKVLRDFPKRIILEPQTPWQEGTIYIITLKKGINTLDQRYETKEEIRLEYTPVEPDLPSYTSPP